MRFIIGSLLVPILATAASAQTPLEKVIAVFDRVCVAPASSEARVAAAIQHAGDEHWKLFRSEAAPMPMMHNENGQKNSFVRAWDFDLPGGASAKLYVSTLLTEQPDFKYTVCMIHPGIDLDSDDLNRSIERQFGSDIEPERPGRYVSQKIWYFVAEKSRGNCGKQVWLDRGNPKFLAFTDFVFPKDWGAARSYGCPRSP
jgi:hypothetical protein